MLDKNTGLLGVVFNLKVKIKSNPKLKALVVPISISLAFGSDSTVYFVVVVVVVGMRYSSSSCTNKSVCFYFSSMITCRYSFHFLFHLSGEEQCGLINLNLKGLCTYWKHNQVYFKQIVCKDSRRIKSNFRALIS